jgi:hypothetical protein
VAHLRPTKVSVDKFELTGAHIPPLFHASSVAIEDVSKHFFEGWYGWGFYAAFSPDFVRRWYGEVVTVLKALPEAKVLVASVDYSSSPPGLLERILEWDAKLNPDLGQDASKLLESRARLMENPLQWVHGCDRLAIEFYDLVIYHDENVVIKNPAVVMIEGTV